MQAIQCTFLQVREEVVYEDIAIARQAKNSYKCKIIGVFNATVGKKIDKFEDIEKFVYRNRNEEYEQVLCINTYFKKLPKIKLKVEKC